MFRRAIMVLVVSMSIHLPAGSQHTPYIWLSDGGAIGENATIDIWLQVGGSGAGYVYSFGPVQGKGTLDAQGRARHVVPVPHAPALIGADVLLEVTAGTNFPPNNTFKHHWIVGTPGTPRFHKVTRNSNWFDVCSPGVLSDGTILLFVLKYSWLLDPTTGHSTELTGFHRHFDRYTTSIVPLSDGNALLVGDDVNYGAFATLYIAGSGTFVDLGPVPHVGGFPVACAVRDPVTGNEFVLYAGGYVRRMVTGSAWLYEVRTRKFTVLPHMVCCRFNSAYVVHPSGAVVITGGMDSSNTAIDRVEAFLLGTRRFVDLGRMAVPRCGHAATWLGPHHILLAAGRGALYTTPMDVELFDVVQRRSHRLPIRLISSRYRYLEQDRCVLTLYPPAGALLSGGANPNIEFLTPYGSIPLPPIPIRHTHQVIPLGGGKLVAIGTDYVFQFP